VLPLGDLLTFTDYYYYYHRYCQGMNFVVATFLFALRRRILGDEVLETRDHPNNNHYEIDSPRSPLTSPRNVSSPKVKSPKGKENYI